jgi:hypothetical protein
MPKVKTIHSCFCTDLKELNFTCFTYYKWFTIITCLIGLESWSISVKYGSRCSHYGQLVNNKHLVWISTVGTR